MSAPFEPGMSRELTIVSTADDSAGNIIPIFRTSSHCRVLAVSWSGVSAELINERLSTRRAVGWAISMHLNTTRRHPLGMAIG